jgi:uncharacterized membrane protein
MWELLALAFIIFLCGSLILPWINRGRIAVLQEEVLRLRHHVARLEKGTPNTVAAAPAMPEPEPVNPWQQPSWQPAAPVQPTPVFVATTTNDDDDFTVTETGTPQQMAFSAQTNTTTVPQRAFNFEHLFGGRSLVWIGGIALAFAGFYLVKYSIEHGYLTEQVRTLLGGIFGLALLAGSQKVRLRPQMADSTRIAQALSGAGIAVLYGVCFAAASVYHLIPPWLGFIGMCGVTATALLLSLLHGAPIAAIGLIGGFVTPMIMHGEPHAPLLFGYFLIIFGSVITVIKRAGWWWLAIPAVLLAFSTVAIWLWLGFGDVDAIWLVLFLIGVSAVTVIGHGDAPTTTPVDTTDIRAWLRYLALGGSTVLIGTVSFTAQFEPLLWDMFGLFASAAFVLAWADARLYGFAPCATAAASLAMLLGWHGADANTVAITTLTFGLLHGVGAYFLLRSGRGNPLHWATLCAMATVLFDLMAYAKLGHDTVAAPAWFQHNDLWGIVSCGLALLLTLALLRPADSKQDNAVRQQIQGIFAGAVAILVALGGMIILEQTYWPCLIAAEILAAGWVNARSDLPATRLITQGLLGTLGILLLPSAWALLEAVFEHPYSQVQLPIAATLTPILFRYGVTAILLWCSSIYLRQKRDDDTISIIETGSVALLATTLYRGIGVCFGGQHDLNFLEQSLVTCAIGTFGWGVLAYHQRYGRAILILCGQALFGLVALRLVGLGLVTENPLGSHDWVGGSIVFNALLLGYGAPILLALAFKNQMVALHRDELARYGKIAAALLVFIFLSMNVRQCYHGAYLDDGVVSNAEIYTYSLAWLILGVAFLLVGTMQRDRMLRIAALPILLLTIGKVFLYDTSELNDLWRVVSFLGLGLSLLGLSWFYTRYVFIMPKSEQQ